RLERRRPGRLDPRGAGFGAALSRRPSHAVGGDPGEHRAAVMSAFHVAAYASLSLPAVLAGIVVAHVAPPTTFEMFGSVVAAIALSGGLEAWRTRPPPQLAG